MGLLQGCYGAGRRLWNVVGASRHLMTICTIAGGVGTGYTLGDNRVGMDPETLRFSKLIILWGSNTLTTNHHLWRAVTTARRNGAHLVAIDPTRTRTADAADSHLALVPGTDAALALGLLHVVLSEGAEDRDFIDRHTLGWDAFRRRILDYPPARVAEICGVPVDAIVELGKRIARTRPTGIRVTMGLQRHGGGGMAVRTITCIPGVTGDWRYPGGGVGYDTRGFFGVNWAGLYRDDLRKTAARALSMTRLGEGLLEVTDPPVKALFVYASNPAASVPHQTKIRRGLARPDLFTVVAEHFRTDTVDYADIVLPATMQLEHADVQISYGHLYISWNEPAVAPPGECLPTTEIFRRLARRLGLDEPRLYDSDEEMARQLLDSDHPSLRGITFEHAEGAGVDAARRPGAVRTVRRRLPHAVREARVLHRSHDRGGARPAGGLHAALRGGPARHAAGRPVPAGADRGRRPLFPELGVRERLLPDAALRPGDHPRPPRGREPRRLETGCEARVFNDRGAFVARVEVTPRVRPGVIASTKGRWPRVSKDGATVNATVDERDADMGGGAVFHDNRVEVLRL